MDSVSTEPILKVLREGGVEYLQNVARAGIEDVVAPLKVSQGGVSFLQSLVPSLVTVEEGSDLSSRLQGAVTSSLPNYLNTTLVEQTNLSPVLKSMASNQIANAIATPDLDPDERIRQAQKLAQNDMWDHAMQKTKATPSVRRVLNPLKEALQRDTLDLSTLGTEMEQPFIQTIAEPIVRKTKASPSLKGLIERSIEIALNPSSIEQGGILIEDANIPMQAWQEAVKQYEQAYCNEQGYSPKAQAYFQKILVALKSPAFWEKSPEARSNQVREMSQEFLMSYVNPKMTRRGFLSKFQLKCKPEPLISKEVGETVLTRRAIPSFLTLNGFFKLLGKVPK